MEEALTFADMTESEQVVYFKIQDALIEQRVMEESSAKPYAATCIARARAYAARVKAMTIHLYLRVWAVEMAARHGTATIKVHHNYLPWVEGFLVTRYGEAVESWPEAITDKDVERARTWKRERPPSTVQI